MVPMRLKRTSVALVTSALLLGGCELHGRKIPTIVPVSSGRATVILAADGTKIKEITGDERRQTIPLSKIPRVLQNAVVAIEDQRFWEHNGIDPKGILRAASSGGGAEGPSQGGSTITQQYIKNTLLSPERTLNRKLQEASLATQLEREYSKEFILEQYLNTIFFGNRSYGVQQAALSYFGHEVQEVTLPEAAMLAGLVQSPSRMNPYEFPEAALKRRNMVIKKMAELSYITDADSEAAIATPITLNPVPAEAVQQRYEAAHFVKEVENFIRTDPRFGDTESERENLLANGGLEIQTTIDLKMQKQAEESVTKVYPHQNRALSARGKDPDIGLVAIEPKTGFVKAMVGGYDYFDTDMQTHPYAQVNLAVGEGRQSGSTFKPLVLAQALSAGVKPTDKFPAPGSAVIKVPGHDPWKVTGHAGGAKTTLTECMVHSINTCFGYLMADERVRPEHVIPYVAQMGVDTAYDPATNTGFQPVISMVLGTNNTTVLDMTEAYTVFANRGLYVPATLVTKVTDGKGTIRYQHQHTQNKILEPENADAVTAMMEQVLTRGTAAGKGIGRPAAGKTGTTQDEADAWFIGYTPDLVTGVWAGFAQTTKKKVGSSGATAAAPVWGTFMKTALADIEPHDFDATTSPIPTTTALPAANQEIFQPVAVPKLVTMPKLVPGNTRDADALARRAGVTLKRVDVAGPPGALPGTVITQAPSPGTKVTQGSVVVIEATAGIPPPTAPVPALVGQTEGAVVPGLQKSGYVITVLVEVPPAGFVLADATVPASGVIWSVEPPAGSVAPDGKITLRVQP